MKDYIDQLWLLFRKHHPNEYSLSTSNKTFIHKEIPSLTAISSRKGNLRAYQSHSNRSAWIYSPWKGERWYAGYEYKGVGENGGALRAGDGMVYGGVARSSALDEHRFADMAQKAGVICQKPLGVYEYGKLGNRKLAVVVRTFTSPIRLSDFLFDRKFFREYLAIRGEAAGEYGLSIAKMLGQGVRRLFDIGLYHGSLGINNITSEGEMADFEPTAGGTWEGVCETEDSFLRYLAVWRILFAGKTIFPSISKEFSAQFASSFFGKQVQLRSKNPALEIAEKYCGQKIRQKLVAPKKGEVIFTAISQVKKLKRNAETREDIRKCNYVLKTLRMRVPARVE
jgi:hypothetical protein